MVPLVVVGVLESGLRLAGYGYPTSFFLEREANGERVLFENDKFGWRFFPREAARSPGPVRLKATKAPDAYRIFLFGESAALGDPKPAYGVGRFLEALLEERFPGTEFEVVCVAMTAINSHAILPIARECARLEGDLWILYMGNNEMEGPFGANTIFGPRAPQLGVIRATLGLRSTKVGQLLQNLASLIKGGASDHVAWEGMKMFLRQQLPPDDPRKQIVYAHFRRNLEDIVQAGLRSGAKPVLCTVSSNLKDCPPFASLHSDTVKESDRPLWQALYERGRQSQSTNEFWEAIRFFEEAARIDAQFAELQFRGGQCALSLTNASQARAWFEHARDCDALPFRTDTALNLVTRDVAGRFAPKGVQLVDAEAGLAAQSAEGIPGEDFFFDHVHFTFDGNFRLALLLAQQVEKNLPASISQKATHEWASPDRCGQRLGLTVWNRSATYEAMLQRLFDAPFTNQLNHHSRARSLVTKIHEARSQMQPSAIPEARSVYQNALVNHPKDFRLHENFAEFLEATGAWVEAVEQWRLTAEILPYHYLAPYQMGRLLAREKKFAEARSSLEKALRLRPDLAEAYLELSQIAIAEGKTEEALKHLAEARKLRPTGAQVLLLRADVLAKQGKRAEAIESLREAIRLRPWLYEAHYLLGVELAVDGKLAEAQAEFEQVVRLRPDHTLGHLNLGVAFARQRRFDDAMIEFKETLRLDPQNPKARQFIANIEEMRTSSQPSP